MSESPWTTIRAIIDELDPWADLTNADWGRAFADKLLLLSDEDVTAYALADAGESYRSGVMSTVKKRANQVIKQAIQQRGANGTGEDAMAAQLMFPVTFEGFEPTPALRCTHWIFIEAERYMLRQFHGIQRNLAFVRHAGHVTEPFPDLTVEAGIEAGLWTAEDFIPQEATA